MIILTLAVAVVACAVQAVRAPRLLSAALWLAASSAFVSMLLFSLGARQAAVIELSVGAGLVLMLFVMAINLAERRGAQSAALVPRPLAWCLAGLSVLLLAELAWPPLEPAAVALGQSLNARLWDDRALDVVVLVILIFAGALTVVGLLGSLAMGPWPQGTGRSAYKATIKLAKDQRTSEPGVAGRHRPAVPAPQPRERQPWC